MLGTFAALAITLASVGVFGVLSYFVTQRTREIGIRVALGATSGDILKMIVGRGLAFAGAGLVVGLLAAAPVVWSMQSLLFQVKPLDLTTILVVSAVLVLVATVASYLPARRALRIEPLTALLSGGSTVLHEVLFRRRRGSTLQDCCDVRSLRSGEIRIGCYGRRTRQKR